MTTPAWNTFIEGDNLDVLPTIVAAFGEVDLVYIDPPYNTGNDFAYADLGFDGYQPPSILQAEGAKEVAVELYSMTKSFSMAGWRVAFLAGNREVVQDLAGLRAELDRLDAERAAFLERG